MTNGIRIILFVSLLIAACGDSVFLSGCIRKDFIPEEPSPPGIECPARLMTDADVLWLCGYETEFYGIVDFIPVDSGCEMLSCTKVQCGELVFQDIHAVDSDLIGTLLLGSESVELICIQRMSDHNVVHPKKPLVS